MVFWGAAQSTGVGWHWLAVVQEEANHDGDGGSVCHRVPGLLLQYS